MKFLAAVFTLFFSSENAFSEDTAVQKLADQLAMLGSYTASFQQTVTEEDGYVLDEHSGVMSFERPNKLYWRVLEPFPNVLVSDGEQVYFYDPDLDQVTIRDWSSRPSENPVAVFIGDADISEYYQVEETKDMFSLTPKDSESGFSKIGIEFKDSALSEMMITDGLGQVTHIHFAAIDNQQLTEIPEAPYSFDIPVTAEVIDDR